MPNGMWPQVPSLRFEKHALCVDYRRYAKVQPLKSVDESSLVGSSLRDDGTLSDGGRTDKVQLA